MPIAPSTPLPPRYVAYTSFVPSRDKFMTKASCANVNRRSDGARAVEGENDQRGIGVRLHDEVVFDARASGVEDGVDAAIDVRVANALERGNVGHPRARGALAEIVDAAGERRLRRGLSRAAAVE